MTVFALSKILCLASGIFGRPAWDVAKCDDRSAMIVVKTSQETFTKSAALRELSDRILKKGLRPKGLRPKEGD